jgi:phosphatidylinositol-3-phosphatase
MFRLAGALLVVMALAAAPTPAAAATRPAPCGRLAAHKPDIRHVLVIVLENHSLGQVIGPAPYLTRLAHACGLATRYRAVGSPSLPNYLAMTSGSTHGLHVDCEPVDCPQAGPSIFSQLGARARLWRAFDQSMPANCELTSSGLYAARHNPAVYYTGIRAACRRQDTRMGTTADGPLHAALHGTLGAFDVVTPNLCDDAHSCPLSAADGWVSRWLPAMRASPVFRAGHTAILITFDEGGGGSETVPLIVVSPYTRPGTRSATPFTHYSLLHTCESLLGLPLLGQAARASGFGRAFKLAA